jgi:ActR/RegA family two-component response regulator/predicted Ser/Thr protein kinase
LPYEARKQAAANPLAANGYTGLCLVVHDDLELRLRLAGLVRRAVPALDAHCVGGAGLENLSLDQLRSYCAVLIIVEFMQKNAGSDPLTAVARLRARVPLMPIFLFARHGNERFAARAMKAGAVDYWPIHSVDVAELAAALQPYVQPGPGAENAPKSGAAATDAGRYPEVAGYRLLKTIAHTAASTVYLARNSDLGQMVALKVQNLQGLASVSDEDRQRFARECEILSSLNHRSIADVIDFGITPEYLYLALEYFPCGSMRERLKNPVSESDALNYARQIAGALQVVHAAGVVHRDLKPSNLMLTTDNRPVLIDFGSARAQLIGHDLSRSDLMTGTPYYVCPEQVDGNDPDQRGDLYSLGIIFYEMLAGRLPFTGSKLTDIFDGHRNGPIPLLPAPLARYQPLINRLLAKKPDDRYASAQHFLEALDAAAASNAASASKTS